MAGAVKVLCVRLCTRARTVHNTQPTLSLALRWKSRWNHVPGLIWPQSLQGVGAAIICACDFSRFVFSAFFDSAVASWPLEMPWTKYKPWRHAARTDGASSSALLCCLL